jgi:hypothetical protein
VGGAAVIHEAIDIAFIVGTSAAAVCVFALVCALAVI